MLNIQLSKRAFSRKFVLSFVLLILFNWKKKQKGPFSILTHPVTRRGTCNLKLVQKENFQLQTHRVLLLNNFNCNWSDKFA